MSETTGAGGGSGRQERATATGAWRAGDAAGLVVGIGLLAAGVLLRRPDVAALGGAPLLAHLVARSRRPRETARLELSAPTQGESATVLRAELATRTSEPTWLRLRATSPGSGAQEVLVLAGDPPRLGLTCPTVRTGPTSLFRVDAIALAPGGAAASVPVQLGPLPLLVLPRAVPLAMLPLPHRLQGLTGSHPARRLGEGGELHDIHEFTPGDRLRRIDWRASARRGLRDGRLEQLYVRRTQALAEAVVMLVLDSRDAVGPEVASWAGGRPVASTDVTSLDIGREAGAALAQAYLRQGDRVGLSDLGARSRPVVPGGGRRHLERLVRGLALAAPRGWPEPSVRAPQLPAGSLVIVLSTFLDEEAARVAVQWRRAGHRVLAVDTLPAVRLPEIGARTEVAWRLVAMQREDRLAALARNAVAVVPWAHDGIPGGLAADVPVGAGAHPPVAGAGAAGRVSAVARSERRRR